MILLSFQLFHHIKKQEDFKNLINSNRTITYECIVDNFEDKL